MKPLSLQSIPVSNKRFESKIQFWLKPLPEKTIAVLHAQYQRNPEHNFWFDVWVRMRDGIPAINSPEIKNYGGKSEGMRTLASAKKI